MDFLAEVVSIKPISCVFRKKLCYFSGLACKVIYSNKVERDELISSYTFQPLRSILAPSFKGFPCRIWPPAGASMLPANGSFDAIEFVRAFHQFRLGFPDVPNEHQTTLCPELCQASSTRRYKAIFVEKEMYSLSILAFKLIPRLRIIGVKAL